MPGRESTRGWLERIHPDDRERVQNAWSNAPDDGILVIDYRLWNQEEGGYRNVRMRVVRIKDDKGSTAEWLGTITDVHELLRLQQRQNDLLAELQHRVRNTLAVVRSIVRRSAETSGSVEEYASHLDGRINALARIQNVLTRSPEATLDLQGLILDELASQGGGEAEKFAVSGPDILLSGSAAGTLSLAFHELATNAVKYGALATPGGSIEVTWDIKPNTGRPLLDIRWREILPRNSTPVPVRRGFGSELIEKVIPYELGGRTSLDLSPTGIVCSIVLPLHNEIRLGQTGPEEDAEGA